MFGLEWKYTYDKYRYGPYSTDLAEEYFDLHESGMPELIDDLPNGFKVGGFMALVAEKSSEWLEIAATLIDQRMTFYRNETLDGEMLARRVESIKHGYTLDFINSVFADLKRQNQISLEMPPTILGSSPP